MSLNTNIINLRELLDKVNALPEASQMNSSFITNKLLGSTIIADNTIFPGGVNQEKELYKYNFTSQISQIEIFGITLHDGLNVTNNLNSPNQAQSIMRVYNFISNDTFLPNSHYPCVVFTIDKNTGIIKGSSKNVAHNTTLINHNGDLIVVRFTDINNNTDCDFFLLNWCNYMCYLKNTLITLANNQTKKVQDITYQDDLLVWDFDNGCYTSAKPLWIKQSQIATQYYHCVFEDNSTLDLVGGRGHAHRIFCLDTNQFEYANDCIGKTIMTQNGPMKLLSCDIIEDNVEFYNIITDYHMNCFANKVLTSTGFSNIYPIENMKYIVDTNREIIPIEAFTNCPEEYYYGMRLGEQMNYTMERMNEKIQNMAAIALPKGE